MLGPPPREMPGEIRPPMDELDPMLRLPPKPCGAAGPRKPPALPVPRTPADPDRVPMLGAEGAKDRVGDREIEGAAEGLE